MQNLTIFKPIGQKKKKRKSWLSYFYGNLLSKFWTSFPKQWQKLDEK